MQRSIIELADRARTELKGAGIVSSGLRCNQHNRNVGGVSDSRHLIGKALDLRIEGKSAQQTLAWAQEQPEVRYAYNQFQKEYTIGAAVASSEACRNHNDV